MRVHIALVILLLLFISGCDEYMIVPDSYNNIPYVRDRRTATVAAQDDQIEIRARTELTNDPIIPYQSRVNVNAYNGTLLVTGETLDEAIHRQIIAKVRIIPGVKRVQDELALISIIHPATQENDRLITNQLQAALDNTAHPVGFSSSNIKVITENGAIYLLGLVYADEAELITNTAQTIPGVNKVVKLFEYLQ